jgi:hypothetical protein
MPTLTASPAMKARLTKTAPPLPRPATQLTKLPAPPKPARPAVMPPAAVEEDPEAETRRRARYQRQNALFLRLRELSPALFATTPPPPMAIGVSAAIAARLELDADGLRDLGYVMKHHVYRPSYQKALAAEGAVRLDLDGRPAGLVTQDERAKAAKTLERLKAKLKARRVEETGR